MKLKSHKCYHASDIHEWLLNQEISKDNSNLFLEAITEEYTMPTVFFDLTDDEEYYPDAADIIVKKVKLLMIEAKLPKTILIIGDL